MHYQADENQNLTTSTVFGNFATFRHAVEVATLYAEFWNPRVLFVTGTPNTYHNTGRAGAFLVPMAGLLVIGIVRALRRGRSDTGSLLLLGGFFLAPIPSTFFPDFNDHSARYATWRAMTLFPFGVLLAGLGLDYMLSEESGRWRRLLAWGTSFAVPLALTAWYWNSLTNAAALFGPLVLPPAVVAVYVLAKRTLDMRDMAIIGAVAIAIASIVQFAGYYRDYLDDYRYRFIRHTDGNVSDVFQAVIDRSPAVRLSALQAAPAIYLGFRMGAMNWGSYYWRFYLHKFGREDLLPRSISDVNASRFGRDLLCGLPPDSIVATRARYDPELDALIAHMSKQDEVTVETVTRSDAPYWVLRVTGSCVAE